MKKLLIIALLSVISCPSWAQSYDATVDPSKKLIDGLTASEIIGKAIHAESEVIVYHNSPESDYTVMRENFNLGRVDAIVKYQDKIYLVYFYDKGSRWIKALDSELSVVTDPPEVDFN